jgi:hypothetical protein
VNGDVTVWSVARVPNPKLIPMQELPRRFVFLHGHQVPIVLSPAFRLTMVCIGMNLGFESVNWGLLVWNVRQLRELVSHDLDLPVSRTPAKPCCRVDTHVPHQGFLVAARCSVS